VIILDALRERRRMRRAVEAQWNKLARAAEASWDDDDTLSKIVAEVDTLRIRRAAGDPKAWHRSVAA
jgi:hypothetical protein